MEAAPVVAVASRAYIVYRVRVVDPVVEAVVYADGAK
jgi:hypothetical protein